MTGNASSLPARPSWTALQAHWDAIRGVKLGDLFAADPRRGERLSAEAAGLYLDYSKQRVTDETLALLRALADACGLRARIDAMFRGDRINVSEKACGASRPGVARASRELDRARR